MDEESVSIEVMHDPPREEKYTVDFQLCNNSTDRNKAESIDLNIITSETSYAIPGIPPHELIKLANFLKDYAKRFKQRAKYLEDFKE